uniref:ZM domain-containing protein n=1 Tax=Elaeophora elaphi TaxID=1147741 RepID=A0A0R3RXM2_9BILA
MYETQTAANHNDYNISDSSTKDLQFHHGHHPSNTMSGYSQHDQPHFSMKPNHLEAVHYERNTYITSDRQSSELRPLRIRPNQYQCYTDKA